jgi:hypothetical protein
VKLNTDRTSKSNSVIGGSCGECLEGFAILQNTWVVVVFLVAEFWGYAKRFTMCLEFRFQVHRANGGFTN